jgi:hypothetical protein
MAGGNQLDPDEIERKLRELNEQIGRPPVHEPTPLERLGAAKKAERKAQRKKDTSVLAALAVVFVLLAGGGIFTWLRLAPPSWLRGGAPTAFADLLTKQERKDFLAGLHATALNKDGSEKNTRRGSPRSPPAARSSSPP